MKISKKILNLAAMLTFLTAFMLPYRQQSSDGTVTEYGYPLAFLSRYSGAYNHDTEWIVSMNVLAFVINLAIFYGASTLLVALYNQAKENPLE